MARGGGKEAQTQLQLVHSSSGQSHSGLTPSESVWIILIGSTQGTPKFQAELSIKIHSTPPSTEESPPVTDQTTLNPRDCPLQWSPRDRGGDTLLLPLNESPTPDPLSIPPHSEETTVAAEEVEEQRRATVKPKSSLWLPCFSLWTRDESCKRVPLLLSVVQGLPPVPPPALRMFLGKSLTHSSTPALNLRPSDWIHCEWGNSIRSHRISWNRVQMAQIHSSPS